LFNTYFLSFFYYFKTKSIKTTLQWLQNSNFETRPFPSIVEYENLQEFLADKVTKVNFFMPIQKKIILILENLNITFYIIRAIKSYK
jgi:hypothetical protein